MDTNNKSIEFRGNSFKSWSELEDWVWNTHKIECYNTPTSAAHEKEAIKELDEMITELDLESEECHE